jgi:hypothetical protein
MGKVIFFLQGQGIEVSPQANAAGAIALPQHAHHARPCNTGVHLNSPLAQTFGHQGGGSVLFKTQFGMGMNVTPQSHKRAHVIKVRNMEHDNPQ